jgi:AraC-like DNA-binding protein
MTLSIDPMRSPPVTVPIAFVHGLLSGAQAKGLDSDWFVARAGIERVLLQQPGAWVTVEQYSALFGVLIEQLDDECIGLLSRPLKRGSFALLARSTIGSANLAIASRRVAHTFKLLQDDIVIEGCRADPLAGLALRFTDSRRPQPPFLHELLLRVFWQLLAWLAGGKLSAARFDFAFSMPAYAGAYRKIFTAPILFDQQQSAVWFTAEKLLDRVLRDEPSLRAFLAEAPGNVLVPTRAGTIGARVRHHLQRTQPEWPDLEACAATLRFSASTLQRRLAREGASFQSLKDELRRDIAIARLTTSPVPLIALSQELGFTDNTAFQRAFKNWTGTTPGAYRRAKP